MGQAPAAGRNSLRTFPRNFPGRSGTKRDAVWLCSPETATAAALTGVITDPRDLAEELGLDYPPLELPEWASVNTAMLLAPLPPEQAAQEKLVKGPVACGAGHVVRPDPLAEPGELSGCWRWSSATTRITTASHSSTRCSSTECGRR